MKDILLGIGLGFFLYTDKGREIASNYFNELSSEVKGLMEPKKAKKEGKYGRKDTLS